VSRFLRWAFVIGFILAGVWMASDGHCYTGNCAIWAVKSGDFVSKNFAGTQAGLDAAIAYVNPKGIVNVFPGCGLNIVPGGSMGDSVTVVFHESGQYRIYTKNQNFAFELAEITTSSGSWVGPSMVFAPSSMIKWRQSQSPFTARPWMSKDAANVASIGCDSIGPIVLQPHNTPVLRATRFGVRIGDNQSPQAMLDVNGPMIVRGAIASGTPPTLSDNTTPPVTGSNVFKCTPASPTTITNFTNGTAGQLLTLIFTNGNATLTDGGNFRLASNFTSTVDDVLRLVYDGTVWYEVGRSSN